MGTLPASRLGRKRDAVIDIGGISLPLELRPVIDYLGTVNAVIERAVRTWNCRREGSV